VLMEKDNPPSSKVGPRRSVWWPGIEDLADQGQLAMDDLWVGTLPANNAADNVGECPGEYNLDPIPGSMMVPIVAFSPKPDGTEKPALDAGFYFYGQRTHRYVSSPCSS